MYAVIETGGKQYRVCEGQVLRVEKLEVPAGEEVSVTRVLVLGEGKNLLVGNPVVAGAKVVLKVLAHRKGKKIRVFKYKPKENYRRRRGHRQLLTEVKVVRIEQPA